MEPTRTKMKVEIGQFRVIATQPNAIRLALGQGVNVWIHMSFEHGTTTDDHISLFAEIPYAISRPTPKQSDS